jgi:simple sugar transport system ATP-binding protein
VTVERAPLLELEHISKSFGGVKALRDVSLRLNAGEVLCLLGDNGAGKSTLIKVVSGVFPPSSGELRVDGQKVNFNAPLAAQACGISTVHQDVDTFPLMNVARNFFLGQEPVRGRWPLRRLDKSRAETTAVAEMRKMGIRRVVSGKQLVGTLSGGERQALAISRALYFGARILILDEPTSALGVKEASFVLRLIQQAKASGVAIVFITHHVRHALTVGDRFVVLIHGAVAAEFRRGERSRDDLLNLMAGGEELEAMEADLEEFEDANGSSTNRYAQP